MAVSAQRIIKSKTLAIRYYEEMSNGKLIKMKDLTQEAFDRAINVCGKVPGESLSEKEKEMFNSNLTLLVNSRISMCQNLNNNLEEVFQSQFMTFSLKGQECVSIYVFNEQEFVYLVINKMQFYLSNNRHKAVADFFKRFKENSFLNSIGFSKDQLEEQIKYAKAKRNLYSQDKRTFYFDVLMNLNLIEPFIRTCLKLDNGFDAVCDVINNDTSVGGITYETVDLEDNNKTKYYIFPYKVVKEV